MKKIIKKLLKYSLVIIGIILIVYLGIRFLAVYPSPLTNIGIVTFNSENWDGNDLTMRLSVTSGDWGTGWNTYDWNTNDIRPGFEIGECYEKGFDFAYPQGFCFSHFNVPYIKSKKAILTIEGIEYDYSDKISVSSSNIGVSGIDAIGSGTLNVEVVFTFYCKLGDEKCSGKN